MRTKRLRALVFGLTTLAAAAATASCTAARPGAATAAAVPDFREGRVELTAAELDKVTAGLAGVGLRAFSTALGQSTATDSDVATFSLGDATGLYEIAYGNGAASAVGETAAVDLSTVVFGDREVVIGATYDVVLNAPGLAEGITGGFVVAVASGHPHAVTIERRAAHLARVLGRDAARLERLIALGQRLRARHPASAQHRLTGQVEDGVQRLAERFERGVGELLDLVVGDPPNRQHFEDGVADLKRFRVSRDAHG